MAKKGKFIKRLGKGAVIGAAAYGVGSYLYNRGYKKHKKKVKSALYERDIGKYMI